MNKRIFRCIFISIAVTAILTLTLSIILYYASYESRVREDLHTELSFLSESVDNLSSIPSGDRRITLIDESGSVLYDSQADASTMENHLGRREVQQAIEAGEGEDIRSSHTLTKKMIYASRLLPDGRVLRISAYSDTAFAFLLSIAWPLLLLVIVLVSVFAFVSHKLASHLTEPINRIDVSDPGCDYPEISPLVTALRAKNREVQEKIENEKKMRESFALIIANMAEGLALIDAKGRILSVNTSFYRLFKADKSSKDESIYAISRQEGFLSSVEEVLAGKGSERFIEIGDRVLHLIASPVKDEGAFIIALDITEKAERDKLRRQFTANVSHELKTPLTSISGFAEILRNGVDNPEIAKDFASEIYKESQRLISLVHDILDLSKLDEGAVKGEKEPCDLSCIATEAISRMLDEASRRNVRIETELESAEVNGYYDLILHMIANLVENAVKYNRDGGYVLVRTGVKDSVPYLVVKDNGIGIPKEDQERVFERFYRVDRSRSRSSGGTGLGLSIVKHAALYNGATVSLESSEGKGTEITVRFGE